ncbi:MAG: methionyl-tRNA formyltransferase [Phycisphaerae bacterium]|nr:methionyl-tRNA formyltransferase [Phycisphaerae bacterium]
MRVVFLGAGEFGLPTLDAIARRHEVPLVVSQPDRPAGRGRRETPAPIAARVLEASGDAEDPLHGALLLRTGNVNADDALDSIADARPDAMVIIAFGQKLGPELLEDRFAINLHASLLPRWRGAAPINRAVMAGDTVSGISVISLAGRMDAGEVHAMRETPIDPGETAGELHDRLAALGPEAVLEVLERLERGEVRKEAQDESLVTHAAKLGRRDATVDFSVPATTVRSMVHGLVPWPGCEVVVSAASGEKVPDRLRLHRVAVVDETGISDRPVGGVDAEGVVACGRGMVRLLEVQVPGGRVMDWKDFRRGRPLPEDAVLRPNSGPVAR